MNDAGAIAGEAVTAPEPQTVEERLASLERKGPPPVSPKLAWLIALVIIVSSIGSGVLSYSLAAREAPDREDLIAQCERGNLSRISTLRLYNDLVGINQGRVDAAKQQRDRPTVVANRYARNQYAQDRADFIESQEPVAIKPGNPGPDGVRSDCEEIYG